MAQDDYSDCTRALCDVYQEIKETLADANIPSSDIEARRIIEWRTSYDMTNLITSPQAVITSAEYERIKTDARERIVGKPLSRLYEYQEFWGLPFRLTKDTLDPRPDTEILVERALAAFPDSPPETILDLGTGSGCILIALLSEWQNSFGIGVDLSQGAVQTAKHNAIQNNVEYHSRFICGSWAESISAKFDLIVSNPPYITNQIIPTLDKEVKNHDPILALDGGKNGLQAYRKIFSSLKTLLSARGKALFEIGYDQQINVVRLAEDSGLFVTAIYADYAGRPRVVEICCGDK